MDIGEAREVAELAVVAREALGTEDEAALTLRLRERADELGAAVHALLAAGDHDRALTMVGSLGPFWQENGLTSLGRQVAASAVDAAAGDVSSPYARAQLVLGELAFRQGDQEVAADATTVARTVAEKIDDPWVVARAEINLARVAFRDGDAARVAEHADRALAAAGDDERIRAAAVHMSGWGEYTAGNVAAAVSLFDQNAATYAGMGDGLGQASELANVADLLVEQGDPDRAAEYLRRALAVPGLRDNTYLGPSLVRSAGVLAAIRGDHEPALRLLGAADALYDRFDLIADPGDDVPHDVMHATETAVGGPQRAEALCAEGHRWSLAEALDAADGLL